MSYEAAPSPYEQPAHPPPVVPIPYARWGRRVAGRLLDALFEFLATLPVFIGFIVMFATADYVDRPDGSTDIHMNDAGATIGGILIAFGFLLALAFWIWNVFVRQGSTGYTLGKSVVGIKLIKISTGAPICGGWAFLREILHTLDSALLYLGWLWPLWDRKRQTFADKIVETVVIVQRPE